MRSCVVHTRPLRAGRAPGPASLSSPAWRRWLASRAHGRGGPTSPSPHSRTGSCRRRDPGPRHRPRGGTPDTTARSTGRPGRVLRGRPEIGASRDHENRSFSNDVTPGRFTTAIRRRRCTPTRPGRRDAGVCPPAGLRDGVRSTPPGDRRCLPPRSVPLTESLARTDDRRRNPTRPASGSRLRRRAAKAGP